MEANMTLLIGNAVFDPQGIQPGTKMTSKLFVVKHVLDSDYISSKYRPNMELWMSGNRCILSRGHWLSIGLNHNALKEVFLGQNFGFLRGEGTYKLGYKHLELIHEACEFFEKANLERPVKLEVGFEGKPYIDAERHRVVRVDAGRYDTTLASLEWLVNWVTIALESEIPAATVLF